MLYSAPIEIETAPAPDASVIWLHGLGADGNDFVPIVRDLRLPAQARLRFVFPHAPNRPVALNGGAIMPAWYDIYGISEEAPQDTAGIVQTDAEVRRLIEREHARGVAYERIVLAGFSQGGSMALYSGLRFPHRLAGLIALSTWLPQAEHTAAARHPASLRLPAFMAHGVDDDMVPLVIAERSYEILEEVGIDVEWRSYPMGHVVIPDEIADIRQWLLRQLA